MKRLRITAAILSLSLLMLILAACGGGNSNVRNDVKVDDIASAMRGAITTEAELNIRNDSYISGMLRLDVSDVVEYYVANVGGTYIDEVGVLKGRDKAHTDDIFASVKAMIERRQENWMDSYMPEEKPKLMNAEYKQLGNYVVYVILSDENRSAALRAFEDALK